jgi:1-acyl-sn-glycerol-3-phosphate acyltransferase
VTGGTGPRVVVANHGSFIDGLALILCLTEPATFVSGDEFASQHIAGPFLRRLGCEFVHRSGPQLMAADASRLNDILREGGALVYFPEGSLDWAAGIRPFNRDPSIQLGGVRRSRRRRAKPGRASGRRSHPSAR